MEHPQVQVVAICDESPARMHEANNKWGFSEQQVFTRLPRVPGTDNSRYRAAVSVHCGARDLDRACRGVSRPHPDGKTIC